MTFDFSNFTRKIYIKAPQQEVFDLWAHGGKLATWFIKKATYTSSDGTIRTDNEYPQAGDSYHWEWHQDLQSKGKVLAVDPPNLFRVTFGKKEPGSDEDVVVSVKFSYQDGETAYTLTQENMGDELANQAHYHLSCNMGWSFFMTNMKAVVEHRADLREHDEDRAMETRAITL